MVELVGGNWDEDSDSDNEISGYFLLSDGSKTQFRIYEEHDKFQWQQWGNSTENKGLTVEILWNYVDELNGER